SVLGRISRCARQLAKGAEMDERLGPVRDALVDMEARLEDAGLSLREFRNSIDMDPQGLERIEDRLEILGRLKRKYGDTLDDVLRARDGLSASEAGLEEGKERLERLTERQAEAARQIGRMAAALSGKRKKAAGALEKAVEKELRQLHMKETRFRVQFETESIQNGKKSVPGIDGVRAEGMDRVEYMISANVGESLRPLSKIASGGELSRIMLAVKTILSRTASVETIIFDEVDSGISGATADVVGRKLLDLADYQQVVCITHLPQIASRGKTHFLVKKEVSDGRTRTQIEALSPAERVREIARILGGREITPRAVAHAKEMLQE
ncbi:MAG: DNA repair protein RecN, partial [Deltaproteobacteria bacterium]|nr:DNA repair protein RecN [Deltaproteobacteria bacterium]